MRDLGGRVWGGGSSGGRELGVEDMGSGVGVRESERDLNAVGPNPINSG